MLSDTLIMKPFQVFSILIVLLLQLPQSAFSQDILYRKNNGAEIVKVKSINGKIITYQIPGDSLGITYNIGYSLLDSLKYSDGKSVDFSNIADTNNIKPGLVSRNYIFSELINSLSGKPNIEFERLSASGRTGYVVGFLTNTNRQKVDHTYERQTIFLTYDPHNFFFRAGINFYPFKHSLVKTNASRLSTGFSGLIGSYRKADYNTYIYDGYSYYYEMRSVLAASLMWNIKERLYLGDHFQVTGGLEISVLPFFAFFCPWAGVSLSF